VGHALSEESKTSTDEGVEARAEDPIRTATASPTVKEDVAPLKEQVARQQRQIEELTAAVKELSARLERANSEAPAGSQKFSDLVASASPTVCAGTLTANSEASFMPDAEAMQIQRATPPADVEVVKGELEAVAESAHQANQRLTKLETSFADAQKKTDARFKGLGNFNFSGDVRLRYEPFIQDGNPTRQRERIRARFNMTGKITDEVSGGISLATGSLDDVNSTNQTLTGFFTRKTIGFDRYFVTYKPKAFKPLSLSAGKFVFPWYRTPLTFDNDINPEGFAQTLSFDLKNPVLTNVTLVGFQLPFNELSGAYDSFVFGGQLQTQWSLGEKATMALYAAGVNFNRADPIAVAVAAGTLKPSLPNSNTFRTDAAGKVIGFASKFAYLDLIWQLNYKLSPRWPLALLFNFVNNTRAGTRERSAYWAEASIGQLKSPKDVQISYSVIRIEKDAVIGAFNESDMRSSTNVRNHRIQFGYQTLGNVTAQWTMWLGKLANPLDNSNLVPNAFRAACSSAPFTGCKDTLLNRMQFDVIYKF